MIIRHKKDEILELLLDFPVVAILGPRQCGKSTLAEDIAADKHAIYLDLEHPDDRTKLAQPSLFFEANRDKLIVLDEIQFMPDLFPLMRSESDRGKKNSRFLVLGSASPELLRQSAESLAGRIAFVYLQPLSWMELEKIENFNWQNLFIRGGFPKSFLSTSEKSSLTWRKNFVQTFLTRDIASFGINISSDSMFRLWTMCAHYHGKLVNFSDFGRALGYSNTTTKNYLEILHGTFMVDLLQPYLPNLSKRLVKSPKIYINDSGILMSLLNIKSFEDLLGNPIVGFAWEGFVLQAIKSILPDGWEINFITTSNDAEIDFIIRNGRQIIAVECKFSTTPSLSRGNRQLFSDLKPDKIFVASPVKSSFFLEKDVLVCHVDELIQHLKAELI